MLIFFFFNFRNFKDSSAILVFWIENDMNFKTDFQILREYFGRDWDPLFEYRKMQAQFYASKMREPEKVIIKIINKKLIIK